MPFSRDDNVLTFYFEQIIEPVGDVAVVVQSNTDMMSLHHIHNILIYYYIMRIYLCCDNDDDVAVRQIEII